MTRRDWWLGVAAVFVLCAIATPSGQEVKSSNAPVPGSLWFSGDASADFEFLSGQARIGYNDPAEFTKIMESRHLHDVHTDAFLGIWVSEWTGTNNSGSVGAYASLPVLLDRKNNRFMVSFVPHEETPMPQTLLSHFLGKAEETTLTGGDGIELKFPFKHEVDGCTSRYTLLLRVSTGAVQANSIEVWCPVKAPTAPR